MDPTPRSRLIRAAAVAALWIAAFLVFLSIQRRLSADAHAPLLGDPGPGGAAEGIRVEMRLGALRFAGASLAMASLILGAGRRLAFPVPVLLTMLLPPMTGTVFDCSGADRAMLPQGLGAAWWYTSPGNGCVAPFQAGWLGIAVDLGLVMLPAVVLALLVAVPSRRSGASPASTILATGCFAIVITFLMSVRGLAYADYGWTVWLSFHLPLIAFGALLGLRRSWWSVALVAVPVALFPLLATSSLLPLRPDPLGIAYLVGITLLGAAGRPVALAIERGRNALGRVSGRPAAVPAGS